MSEKRVLAIAAHPDDIEFMMTGTLVLLGRAGYELHEMNIANGSCGTAAEDRDTIVARRTEEAREAARSIGAHFHPPIVDDLEIFYCAEQLRKITAVVREVRPSIVLLQSPEDYMEDHMNACRIGVSAAFFRGMRNWISEPPQPPIPGEVTLYHALPYGLCDGMRRRIEPSHYVDIGEALAEKRAALACHKSQKEWLDTSQGLDSYLNTMEEMAATVGTWSGHFTYAEGWRLHSHLGFCGETADPLRETLKECILAE